MFPSLVDSLFLSWQCFVFLWLGFHMKGALSLRIISLNIPEIASPGQGVRLACSYDLEGDELYSIKWYRDEVEFYRYVPIDRPPSQYFPLEGVNIDADRSLNGTVIIHNVDFATTGNYRCEVSADAPSFETKSAQKYLTVQEISSSQSQMSRGLLLSLVTFLVILL